MPKFIDLSVPVQNGAHEPAPPEIEYVNHEESPGPYGQRYGLAKSDFRNGQYCATEKVKLTTHTGTHVDSPWHYGATCEGRPAPTIDQLSLHWFFSDGVVLNFSDRPAGYGISGADLQAELDRIEYQLKPADIVMIRTDTLKRFGDQHENWQMHPGLTRESTGWILDRGIKVIGIDAYAIDRPARAMLEDVRAGHKERFWEAHYLGIEREYYQIEKLFNLDLLPPFGFKVAAFPVKVAGGSAGWTRAVAIID